MNITDEMKLKCVKRELKMRESVYPAWVRAGRMKEEQAEYELAVMRAIRDDYARRVQPDMLEVARQDGGGERG